MKKHLAAVALATVLAGGSTATAEPTQEATYQGKTAKWWAKRAVQARKDANARGRTIRRLRRTIERSRWHVSPTAAIQVVFGSFATQAMAVAWCESKYSTGAENGQYLGLFQMGSRERRLYGHGPDAITQARAAYAYFVASGRDWSPWSCQP